MAMLEISRHCQQKLYCRESFGGFEILIQTLEIPCLQFKGILEYPLVRLPERSSGEGLKTVSTELFRSPLCLFQAQTRN